MHDKTYDRLYAHQKDGCNRIVTNPRYALWWDTGVGKTPTALVAIDHHLFHKTIKNCLVICPKSIIDAAWLKDARTWAPWCVARSWHAVSRQQFLNAQLGVINFESYRINEERIPRGHYDMVIVDESQKLKEPTSKTSKCIRRLCDRTKRVLLLSGTPAPNDALEYWAQMYCVDPNVLGPAYYRFRVEWGKQQVKYVPHKVTLFSMDQSKLPAMLDRISTVSHTLRKEDCLDLPEQVDVVRDVYLNDEERKTYEKMQHDLVLKFSESEAVAVNALAEIMKLRQICNGWVYDTNGEANYFGASKLNVLLELLESIGRQAIIWVEYNEDANRIRQALGEGASVQLVGGMSMSARNAAIDAFQGGKARFLIAHPAAAGHGLTFTNCSDAVYYSVGYSYELYHQSRARTHRFGQRNTCTYYHLQTHNTVEPEILAVVQGKKTVHDFTMEMLHGRS